MASNVHRFTRQELRHRIEQTKRLLSQMSDEVTRVRLKALVVNLEEQLRLAEEDADSD